MSSYCDVDNAYIDNSITSNEDLEKMARRINSDKMKKTKDVYDQYKKNADMLERGSRVMKEHNMNDCSIYPQSDIGFYSAQGKYSGSLTTDISKSDISIDTPSSDDLSSLDSLDTNNINRQVRLKSKYTNIHKKTKRRKCLDFDLKSIDSLESLDSGESLLKHIKSCTECKSQVVNLIKKHKAVRNHNVKHTSTKHILSENNMVGNNGSGNNGSGDNGSGNNRSGDNRSGDNRSGNNRSGDNRSGNNRSGNNGSGNMFENIIPENTIPEIKEIVAICLIGFLIIIILDSIMN